MRNTMLAALIVGTMPLSGMAAVLGSAPAGEEGVIVAALVQEPTLARAARERDFATVLAVLKKKPDVNQQLADGTTALDWAVRWNDIEIVRRLIKAGADVNGATSFDVTPLYLAALNGSSEMVRVLLAAKANPNQRVLAVEATPLMYAARSGDAASVRMLLKAGADINAGEGYRGTTALMWAAERDNDQVAAELLTHGANANLKSKVQERWQSGKGREFIRASASGTTGEGATNSVPGTVEVKNPVGGVTALILAARENSLRTAKVLLDAGVSVNEQSGDGSTALLVAIQNEHLGMARLLLKYGADVNIANKKGWFPLYIAVKNRTLDYGNMPPPSMDSDAPPSTERDDLLALIQELIARGANVNARIKGDTDTRNSTQNVWLKEAGATAFLRASFCADLPVMQLLLEHGADPKITTEDGTTALAALAGVGYGNGTVNDLGDQELSIKAMRLLIGLGIDVNANNKENVSPLAGAIHKNFLEAMQLLVDHGADLTVVSHHRGTFERRKDFKGNTLMDWAWGVMTGGETPLAHPKAIELLGKMLQERNLLPIRYDSTDGGVQGASEASIANQKVADIGSNEPTQ